jgi:hypothetical protein
MGWNEKYWDIVDRYYWSPGELGLHSIAKKKWTERKGLISVPAELVNHGGPLYTRQEAPQAVRQRLERTEEALNDLFDLTFAIASDVTISSLLFRPLDIYDGGPFTSLGNEILERYGWGDDNVPQPDGFFVSERSTLGVKLKLAAPCSADQLITYLALMALEERKSGPRQNCALLFIAPRADEHFWSRLGLEGPKLHEGFLEASVMSVSNPTIRGLLETNLTHFRATAARLHMALITWSDLHTAMGRIMQELDRSAAGDQTLHRLLAGFCDQIKANPATGIHESPRAA